MGVLDFLRPVRTVERTVYISGDSVKGMSASRLYETQPALRSVVSFLADNVAGLPLKCYVRQPDGGRERDRDSVLAKTLARPNAWSTGHELIRATVSEYLLHDDSLWLTVPTSDGWTIAVIPHDWISPKTRDGLEVEYITIRSGYMNGEAKIKPEDYLRFTGWSPYGSASSSSKIEALKQILSEQISAWNFRNGVWKNGGQVTQWISRPADTPWGEGARERFAKSWKSKFSGGGTDTGGTPLLEDGMRLEQTGFNAREAQWAEATRLSREDVCAVYHVNPGLIYHTDAQTYASAKDNARALYSDTLAPILDMIEERINAFLVPRMGLPDTYYVEFDLDAKLQGSFEERAGIIQSSVGAPWMTRNEARSMLNLPTIDGGDELVVPLNVLTGGQASPNDVDGVESGYNSSMPETKSAGIRVKGSPQDTDAKEITRVLKRFFERQKRSVSPKIEKSRKDGNYADWWDSDRWERELADDLEPVFMRQATMKGREVSRQIGSSFDSERIENYIKAMARGKSKAINNVTYRELMEALDGEFDDDAMGSTVSGVFEKAEETRSETSGRSFATAVIGFAVVEAVSQSERRQAEKTWIVTSSNPRAEHAAMDGETVPFDDVFSNGAKYPGDQVLTPEESCNCQCQVEILIP